MEDDRIKVLVIEDNPDYAFLIQEMLAEAGLFDLEFADRLSGGMERLSRGGINAVILDLSLPDSRGLDTFVKAHALAPDIPIVILTAFDDSIAGKAMEEGAEGYLLKSQIDGDTLGGSIRRAVERRGESGAPAG